MVIRADKWLIFLLVALSVHPLISVNAHAEEDDYYQQLGVSRTATPDEIKAAHRKIRKYHPDKFIGKSEKEQKEAEEQFKLKQRAYDVLSDPEKRRDYDARRGTGKAFSEASSRSIEEVFEDLESDDRGRVLRGLNSVVSKKDEIARRDLAARYHRDSSRVLDALADIAAKLETGFGSASEAGKSGIVLKSDAADREIFEALIRAMQGIYFDREYNPFSGHMTSIENMFWADVYQIPPSFRIAEAIEAAVKRGWPIEEIFETLNRYEASPSHDKFFPTRIFKSWMNAHPSVNLREFENAVSLFQKAWESRPDPSLYAEYALSQNTPLSWSDAKTLMLRSLSSELPSKDSEWSWIYASGKGSKIATITEKSAESAPKVLEKILERSPNLKPAEVIDLIEPLSRTLNEGYILEQRKVRDVQNKSRIKYLEKSRDLVQSIGKQYLDSFLLKNPMPLEESDYKLFFRISDVEFGNAKGRIQKNRVAPAKWESVASPSRPGLVWIQPSEIDGIIQKLSHNETFELALTTLRQLKGDTPAHYEARRKFFEALWAKRAGAGRPNFYSNTEVIQLIRAVDLHPAADRPDLGPDAQKAMEKEFSEFRKFCLEPREPKLISVSQSYEDALRREFELILKASPNEIYSASQQRPSNALIRCLLHHFRAP